MDGEGGRGRGREGEWEGGEGEGEGGREVIKMQSQYIFENNMSQENR